MPVQGGPGSGPGRAVILHTDPGPAPGPDRLDSLVQAKAVAAVLNRTWRCRLTAYAGGIRTRLFLVRYRPDLVVNLVEDIGASSRTIADVPALLAGVGVRYTGSDAKAMALTTDKLVAKRLMVQNGIPTPAWIEPATGVVKGVGGAGRSGDSITAWLVKPVAEEASVGLDPGCLCGSDTVAAVLADRKARFGGAWFAEEFVDGREFNLSVLDGPAGPEVLPVAEMQFLDFPPERPRILDYAAKWHQDSFEYRHTVRAFRTLSKARPLAARLGELALRCWRVFGLAGYARVDVRLDAAGTPLVLEVNANPCVAPDAGFIAAAAEADLPYSAVVQRIVAAALRLSQGTDGPSWPSASA